MLKTDTCRYFTGTANKVCERGIEYEAIKTPSGIEYPPMYQWAYPCSERMRHGLPLACEMSSFPTPEEEKADRERLEAKFKEWAEKIEKDICPHCDQHITKQQIGRCVYGSCGHRLYQGRLKKEVKANV
jgi:hypothetical protein